MLCFLFLIPLVAVTPEAISRYFLSGFTHILPGGLDHILFILGIFFLSRSFSSLLLKMTLFTLAHSITFGLSLYGFISLPAVVVEVAIALGISFIAIENLVLKRPLPVWQPCVVFAFGLIHGLGFAHSFAETSVPPADFLPALFGFNFGLEVGQLAVVALAFAAVGVWRNRDWYFKAIARPACLALAASGLYLAVQRIAF